ncbi:MAG: hypothetical protein AAGF23_20015, partial [Acidobacteriota bacterium]
MVPAQRLELGPVEHRQHIHGQPRLDERELARARLQLPELTAGGAELQAFDRRPDPGLAGAQRPAQLHASMQHPSADGVHLFDLLSSEPEGLRRRETRLVP